MQPPPLPPARPWMSLSASGYKDSQEEEAVYDPYAHNKVQPGLGTDARLQQETIVLDTNMEKFCAMQTDDRRWQQRRVVLTTTSVFFFKEGSPQIVDLIPLTEVDSITLERITGSGEALKSRSASTASLLLSGSAAALVPTKLQRSGSAAVHSIADATGIVEKDQQGRNFDQLLRRATRRPDCESADDLAIVVQTNTEGIFQGKKYVLRCKPPEAATEWVKESSRHAHEEKRKLERMTSLRRVQSRLQVYYEHSLTQSLIAFLILANFASTMIELQMPDKTEKEKSIFASLDSAFTIIFLVELIIHMTCHWFWPFWGSPFNIFDFVVVTITAISMLDFLNLKVISTLRLLRAFRVVRIFGRLGSARRIITAIGSSLEPVCNVLIIVAGMMSVFAMFGCTSYPDCPLFRHSGAAMYTMFTCLTMEGWVDLVVETEEYYPGMSSVPPKLFFMTYIFIVVYILLPVFVAAVLDGYRTSAYQQSQQDMTAKGREALETIEDIPCFSFDPIMHGLFTSASTIQLDARIKQIFQVLDSDDNGSVSFSEMRLGFQKIMRKDKAPLTHQEFETLTTGSKGESLLDGNKELDLIRFMKAMKWQLRNYSTRKLSQYIVAVGEEEPGQELMMFALKVLLTDNEHTKGDDGGKIGGGGNETDDSLGKLELMMHRMELMERRMELMMHNMENLTGKRLELMLRGMDNLTETSTLILQHLGLGVGGAGAEDRVYSGNGGGDIARARVDQGSASARAANTGEKEQVRNGGKHSSPPSASTGAGESVGAEPGWQPGSEVGAVGKPARNGEGTHRSHNHADNPPQIVSGDLVWLSVQGSQGLQGFKGLQDSSAESLSI